MYMSLKKCSKCKVPKELTNFNKNKSKSDGLSTECKECSRKNNNAYRINHKEELNKKHREYWKDYSIENKTKLLKKSKDYYSNNKEKEKLRNAKYYKNNKKKVKIRHKKYHETYQKNRSKKDVLFKMSQNIRNLIRNSINTTGAKKKTKTSQILGCSFADFKTYLESKFEPWMNWENHGKYNGEPNYGWDLDHIIPSASANSEEEIIKLNHHTNFQPLCSYINRYIKRNK